MATTYEILGQSKPGAAALVTLITCPDIAGNARVCSNVHVCNQSATPDLVRIAVIPKADIAGGVLAKHYIAYDIPIAGNGSLPVKVGITLARGDIVKIYSLNATCSFSGFGFTYTS